MPSVRTVCMKFNRGILAPVFYTQYGMCMEKSLYIERNVLYRLNKTLGETTTEDIQLKVHANEPLNNEETLLQLIELYVY